MFNLEAKAIYAYICSFAGTGTSAFPGIKIIRSITFCERVGLSKTVPLERNVKY
ncbi:hypothetical protein [Carnobacterium sp. TMP28]|uniref:hypothetical protein n=1 Tax=Carnobacterium sp. TMP28 TaxID=3397060 RepID=UPI0039E08A86